MGHVTHMNKYNEDGYVMRNTVYCLRCYHMSHVTPVDESCDRFEGVRWIGRAVYCEVSALLSHHSTAVNETCKTYEWVMLHLVDLNASHAQGVRYTVCAGTCIVCDAGGMSHATHVNKSCSTCE